MQEGSIPDFTENRRSRGKFIVRARKVVQQQTGAEPPNKEWCRDHLDQAEGKLRRCQQCKNEHIECYWDNKKDELLTRTVGKDAETGLVISLPVGTEDIVPFCSPDCRMKYVCSPACPKSGACQKHMLRQEERTDFEGAWPNPVGHIEHAKHCMKIVDLRSQLAKGKANVEDQIKMAVSELPELEKNCHLPILVCRECKEDCEPRSGHRMLSRWGFGVPSTFPDTYS